jgi:hypothetical protein
MDGIYLILCLAIILFLAVVALVIVILDPGRRAESQSSSAPAGVVVHETKNPTSQHNAQQPAEDVSPQIHLERSREAIEKYNAAEAKKHALAAFRGGDREIRLQAIKLLHALHEVEQF